MRHHLHTDRKPGRLPLRHLLHFQDDGEEENTVRNTDFVSAIVHHFEPDSHRIAGKSWVSLMFHKGLGVFDRNLDRLHRPLIYLSLLYPQQPGNCMVSKQVPRPEA